MIVTLEREKSNLCGIKVIIRSNNQKLFSVVNLKNKKTNLQKGLLDNKDCNDKIKLDNKLNTSFVG